MADQDDIKFGDEVAKLVNDPLLQEIISLLETDLFDEWVSSKNEKQREEIHAEMLGANRFFARMKASVDDAIFLKSKINKEQ
tara:strand:- start:1484 stop:1729 length:246 start_codon:yes stop_codon:yes gene_type:complete